jgi:hypothetical protein
MKKLLVIMFLTISTLFITGCNNSTTKPNNNTLKQVTTTPTSTWSLWSGGTKLRGANIYQRLVYQDIDNNSFGPGPVGPVYIQKDFDNLSKLGANWVQIEHPGLYNEKPPYKLNIGIQNNLDKLIAMAKKSNMFVTIAFRTGPGRSEFTFFDEDDDDWFPSSYRNDKVWKNKDTQTAWDEMWKYTANRYKNESVIVGYNLMVEPNAETRAFEKEISEPSEFYPKYANTLADWNQMYPNIVKAIRQIDKTTPILIGQMGYSSVSWLPYIKKINDPYIVYSAHQYEPIAYTHDAKSGVKYPDNFKWYGTKINLDKKYLEQIYNKASVVGKNHNRPITIDEFGVYRYQTGADKFINDSINTIEKLGMNHAIWVWDSISQSKNMPENDQFDFTHGPKKRNHEPTNNNLLNTIQKYWTKNSLRPF